LIIDFCILIEFDQKSIQLGEGGLRLEKVRERSKNRQKKPTQLCKPKPDIREHKSKFREMHLEHITWARRKLGFRACNGNRIYSRPA